MCLWVQASEERVLTTSEYRGTPYELLSLLRDHSSTDIPAAFAAMIDALRDLQEKAAGSRPPEEVAGRVATVLASLAEALGEFTVDEAHQLSGRLGSLPGRGQTMVPVVEIEEFGPDFARGYVTFGRFYLGGNGAVHGGAIPLAIDELMGRLSNTGGWPPSRTAYLHVNYRSITPIERRLAIEVHIGRQEGRKKFLSASIRDGDVLCADAEGLFVALRPGQP
jgi:acyl-coenzyme A thioesterase PaaI-like protein